MFDRDDRIGWRQIGVGYVVCLCVAAALISILWLQRFAYIETATTAVIVLGALLVSWLEPHLRQWQARVLAGNPGLDLTLKRSAVALLCLVSLATTALSFVVWRQLPIS